MLWKAMVEIPANRMAAKCFMRMVFSPVRTRATAAGRDMAAYREIVTKERRVTVSRGQALAAYGPHPGEPAPKSGLPDFGNQKVSKSATADFDAGASKNGSKQPKAAVADFGNLRAEV